MDTKYAGDWSIFAPWELALIRGKAHGLSKHTSFNRSDVEEIEQVLRLHLLSKRKYIKDLPTHTASNKTVTSRILDSRVRDLIKAEKRLKRRGRHSSEDCSERYDLHENYSPLENTGYRNRNGSRHRLIPQQSNRHSLRVDLSIAQSRLSRPQQDICSTFRAGNSVSDTARILGMKRTTLNRERVRISKVLRQGGLHEYC